jgi:hypothetical protein
MRVVIVDSSRSGYALASKGSLSSSSRCRHVTILRKLPAGPPFMGPPHISPSPDPPLSKYKPPTSLWKGEGQRQHPRF